MPTRSSLGTSFVPHGPLQITPPASPPPAPASHPRDPVQRTPLDLDTTLSTQEEELEFISHVARDMRGAISAAINEAVEVLLEEIVKAIGKSIREVAGST